MHMHIPDISPTSHFIYAEKFHIDVPVYRLTENFSAISKCLTLFVFLMNQKGTETQETFKWFFIMQIFSMV